MTNFKRGMMVMGLFALLGTWLSWQSKDSPDFYVGKQSFGRRDPAAIRSSYDFSTLNGVELMQATKQRLVAEAQLLKEHSDLGIELGHFVVRNENGEKSFACDKYSDITLNFEGDGMAIAGEKPQMEVEGSCEISADINRIAPLWIPVAKILGEPVGDGEFSFLEQNTKVRFKNVAGDWPRNWILRGVTMQAKSGETLEITNDELHQLNTKPIILEFNQ